MAVEVSAQKVKELREATGAGFNDCRKALMENGNDFDKAADYLRKKGMATAAKKADRVANEGVIHGYMHHNGRLGVMVEVNCETDFVARNDQFKKFAKDLSLHIANHAPRYMKREDVPEAEVQHEREIQRAKTLNEGKKEAVDVARWAHNFFKGPLFLFGVSAGGSLTYYAAASGTPAQAIACVNLLDFGDPAIGKHFMRHPHLISLIMMAIPWLSLIGWLHVPMKLFARSEQQQHEDCQQFQLCWRADPVIPPHLTVRALISYLTTPPPIPFEANEMPVLVLNQGADQIIDPAFTRRNYERLSGRKNYIELEGFGHWSTEHRFWHTIVDACDQWFQTVSLENTLS